MEDQSPGQVAVALPVGRVTFLLADVAGPTRSAATAEGARAYHAILSEAVAGHGGARPRLRDEDENENDGVVATFPRAADALAAAHTAQWGLYAHGLRIALHTTEMRARDDGRSFGAGLRRCAQLRAIAHGGQVLLSRATRDLVAGALPERVALVDLGVHRLRDLGRPEHVFGLVHPDVHAGFGPLRSLDVLPNNLPDQPTAFVGREREQRELREALGASRLLTLCGAGGCGKTRLGLQAAADALDHYCDGVWWVALAPLTDPALVGDALAAAVGAHAPPGQSALEAALERLATSRALVLLDNCEHLLGGAAEIAEALLHRCPDVTVLATSRSPLGLAAETTWRVPSLSLSVQGAREPLDALGRSDAVRLFTECALAVRPSFTLTTDNAPGVTRICTALDGIPLAIELAAARLRVLSADQIDAGLQNRFHLLTGGGRRALARHRTLRASVDWSHDALAADERSLFRRLGVFRGGFTLEAVEQVAAGDDRERAAVVDLLASLVDKSLVVAEERGPAVRYGVLETMREYALERLTEAGEADAVRARHRDAFLALAERAAPELADAHAGQWLDLEASNLAAALDWAAETDAKRALRLCVALTPWWKLRGRFVPAEWGFGRALDAADPAPSALRARVLWGRAYLLRHAADFERAIDTAQQALAMAEEVGDQGTLARALAVQGAIQLHLDPLGCRAGLERSRELARAGGDDWCLIDATQSLAYAHLFCDEYEEAERLLEAVLPLTTQTGYLTSMHWIGMSFGPAVRAEAGRAFERAERALAVAREVGEPVSEGIAHEVMALLELAQGHAEPARVRLEASRERLIATRADMTLHHTDTLLAAARAALGDLDAARAGLEAVIAGGADFGRAFAWALVQQAEVLRVTGDATAATDRARQALDVSERMQGPLLVSWSKEVLGRLAAGRGAWDEAEALLQDALGQRTERRLWLWLPQTLDALAEVAAGVAAHQASARILGAAERGRTDLGLTRWAPDQPRFAALEHSLCQAIGETAFGASFAEGTTLTLQESASWLRRARGSRKRPSCGWESLTPTERRVVGLVAEGLTNPQIGERMFIARGTVKVHVSHIFAKLSVASRAQLASEATRREVLSPPS